LLKTITNQLELITYVSSENAIKKGYFMHFAEYPVFNYFIHPKTQVNKKLHYRATILIKDFILFVERILPFVDKTFNSILKFIHLNRL
jgi:hypothetical protein